MKPNQEPESDGQFSPALREWVVDTALPPRFQEQVWQRIACAEAQVKPSAWHLLRLRLEFTFSRPALAFSYLAILLFGGLTTGYWQAHGRSGRDESQWRARYVQSVDPYQVPRN